jgi:hypothetical protein
VFTAACLPGFLCYLRMSSTVATNSDGASNALQAACLVPVAAAVLLGYLVTLGSNALARQSSASWYDPRLHGAHFVLLFSGQSGFSGQAGLQPFDPASQVLATFGPPAQTYDLGRYTVLVWHQNLLRRL